MTAFMVGHPATIIRIEHDPALNAKDNLFHGVIEIDPRDRVAILARGEEGRLIDQVAQLGADQAGRNRRQFGQAHFRCQRHIARMHPQDGLATSSIRPLHCDPAVKAARTQQRGVKHVRTVRRRQDDHRLPGIEAIHFSEQLIQGLLALIVSTAEAGPTLPANRVKLVDER